MSMKKKNIKARYCTTLSPLKPVCEMGKAVKDTIPITRERWQIASVYLERHLLDRKLDRVVNGKTNHRTPYCEIGGPVLSVQTVSAKTSTLSRKNKRLSLT